MAFPFEKLVVYQRSVAWVRDAFLLRSTVRSVYPPLDDQLCRAAISIPLNIAEGNGRWQKADRQRFFGIALGSIYECVAVLQILKSTSALGKEAYELRYEALEHLARMLQRLISSVDDRPRT